MVSKYILIKEYFLGEILKVGFVCLLSLTHPTGVAGHATAR